jgi:hypothetical protein
VKRATIRFYFDADILGLAKILANLRYDITYPGDPGAIVHKHQRPACPIQPRDHDTDWIPTAASAGWLIITRDANIRVHRAEINAVIENGPRLVALASQDANSKWKQLELAMTQWRAIEKQADLPGPFVHAAYRTTLTPIT